MLKSTLKRAWRQASEIVAEMSSASSSAIFHGARILRNEAGFSINERYRENVMGGLGLLESGGQREGVRMSLGMGLWWVWVGLKLYGVREVDWRR